MASLNSIRDTFFEECEELLEALGEGLAQMAEGAHDGETVNAVFRAVHSIKGGAGAFALNALVAFAHRFETVLDGVRSDRIALTGGVMHVLQRSADHLSDLVEAARDGAETDPEVTAGFLAGLDAVLGGPPEDGPADTAEDDPCFGFAALPLDLGIEAEPGAVTWQISFRPLPALYLNGHDPALILLALADLGPMEVTLDSSALPPLAAFDPAGSYLAWTIRLTTAEPETVLHATFEFVEDLCELDIRPADAAAFAPEPEAAEPAPPGPLTATIPTLEPAPDPAPGFAGPQLARRPAEEDSADRSGPKPTLRVDLERVDRLINAVGELIINQAMIEQSLSALTLPADAEVISHVEDYRLLARDIQEAVMAIRAQPVKPLFQRMSRILREAAAATGKQARLVTAGEATEVDKTVIERLADPLTHMIRNAVDHGLESRDRRLAAGKDAEGTIRLSAAHRSGNVVITVRDDGAGLDRARIRSKAVARGLIAAETELSDAEIDALLFAPGFSTADTVSNLSGRGVGLDVVKNAVLGLGGRISIASTPGEGTEFTITLPLTLAVMDGMVISVAGQTMVVPITSVVETIRPGPGDLHRMGTAETLLSIRGRFIPMIDVATSLGFARTETDEPPLLLLVETETQAHCALAVDAVQDQRQVVIKGLESNYGHIPGVSAATVLGDGRIALILDADALASTRPAPPRGGPSAGTPHASL